MKKYILIIIAITIIFSGTDNIRELTDIAIVKAIGVDKGKDGNYEVSVIVEDTSDKEALNKGIIYESSGISIQEALRKCVDTSPKRLYLAHLESLIVSEEIAQSDIQNILDFFIRDNEGSNSFHFLISKEASAKDMITKINEDEIDIVNLLVSSQKNRGNCNLQNLNDLVKEILEKGKDICVNTIKIEDEKIKISNMAYFSSWNFKGYITEEESILYNLLNNYTENAIITLNKEDNVVVAELLSSKSKIKLDEQNNVKIIVDADITITQTGKNVMINSKEEIDNIENQLEEKVNEDINSFMNNINNNYDVDIMGLENLYYRKKKDDIQYEKKEQGYNISVESKFNLVSQGGVKKNW